MTKFKIYGLIHPIHVTTHDSKLWVELEDERVISTPLYWYPWLAEASIEQQQHFELLPDAIYWTDLDEGLEIEGMLRGIRPSPSAYQNLTTETNN